jgi:hypothetical protein
MIDDSAYNWFVGMLDSMGQEKGLEYMKKLVRNGLQTQQGRSNVENMVAAGEVPVMLANSGTSTADRIAKGETVLTERWQRMATEKIKIRPARPGIPDPLIDANIKPHFVNPSKWPPERYEAAQREYVRIIVRKDF